MAEIIGGPGEFETLYHYSETDVSTPIRPWNFWTNFCSDNPADVSRVTGTEERRLRYRSEARVNRNVIDGADPWFTNQATKFVEGLGAFDEYINRKAVQPNSVETVQIGT